MSIGKLIRKGDGPQELERMINTMIKYGAKWGVLTLLDFENAILDLFEDNRIPVQDAKIVLWTILTAIYEDELVEEPERREIIISNIERVGIAAH